MKRIWKIIAGAIAAVVVLAGAMVIYLSDKIYLRDGHQLVQPSEFERPISPDAVRDDIAYLVEMFRKIHPSFQEIGGNVLQQRAATLAAEISAPMTRLEAYRRIASLNQHIRDGHTYLRAPAEERGAYEASGGRYLPFTVELADDRTLVARSLVDDIDLSPGDEISTINGRGANDLARSSLADQSGEREELRRAYAAKGFYRHLWTLGIVSPFEVEVVRDGTRFVVRHEGLTASDYLAGRDAGSAPYASFEALGTDTGLLTFDSMPSDGSEFRDFLESTFATIRTSGIGALIIDLRENGGGDSRSGDALMAYLSVDDLPSVDYVDVKVTEEIKQYYRTLLPPGFQWIPLHRFVPILQKIHNTEPGGTFRFKPGPAEPRPRSKQPENAFNGDLYVLIGPRTYSSAVIFAAPLKHYGRATFVGEETGEPLIFFGENYYFDLPHTKLQAQVSHKRFVLVGAKDEHTGILPDIRALNWATEALPAALEAIDSIP